MRTSLHHLLVERRLAWSACNQAAAGLKFFYTKTLGWDVLSRHLPPRTGRSQLPQILSIEELQRLCTQAKNPRHRLLLAGRGFLLPHFPRAFPAPPFTADP